MNRRTRAKGKIRHVAFDSQFEVTPCVPEQNIVLDGVNCRLIKYIVNWLCDGNRKTIAVYEETTALDAELEKLNKKEQELWDEWDLSHNEATLEALLLCTEQKCKLLGVETPFQTEGRTTPS